MTFYTPKDYNTQHSERAEEFDLFPKFGASVPSQVTATLL